MVGQSTELTPGGDSCEGIHVTISHCGLLYPGATHYAYFPELCFCSAPFSPVLLLYIGKTDFMKEVTMSLPNWLRNTPTNRLFRFWYSGVKNKWLPVPHTAAVQVRTLTPVREVLPENVDHVLATPGRAPPVSALWTFLREIVGVAFWSLEIFYPFLEHDTWSCAQNDW